MKEFEKELNGFFKPLKIKLEYKDNDILYRVFKMFDGEIVYYINIKNYCRTK